MDLSKSEKDVASLSSFDSLENSTTRKQKNTGRISNSLNINIATRKQLSLFDILKEEEKDKLSLSDKANYVDRKGKPVILSVEEIQIIKALSSYLPFDKPEVKDFITTINTIDAKGNFLNAPKAPIQIPVSIIQLSKDIIGDTKEASLKKIAERIERLEQIEQIQTFNVKGETFSVVRPLIRFNEKLYKHYSEIRSSKGRKKAKDPEAEEQKILVAANIIYSPLFLYEAANKYCPLYPQKLFEVWRRNKTELFSILLSDLESKFRQYYLNSLKTERKTKEENKSLMSTDREEYNRLIEEAKKKALIYKSSTQTIRDRVTTDYETDRKQRSRFIPDLQRAIKSLVEYGIITDRSVISKDKEFVFFCYNPDFTMKEDDYLQTIEEVKEESD